MVCLKKNMFSVFLIAALATVIYSNSFEASFHFDDRQSIIENYSIHRFDLKKIFSTSSRPILDITFAINYYFGKLNVFGYHVVNLLLHIANGIMLYFILLLTINATNPIGKEQRAEDEGQKNPGSMLFAKTGVPLYASLIFIAHPVQTQAVTYIVSRSSVLATTFYLLTVLLFIQAFKQMAGNREQKTLCSLLYFVGAFIASCLGMGTKQIAATLPLTLLIYDFYFISDGNWRVLKSHYKIHLAMFSTIAVAVYLSFSGLNMFVSFDYSKGVSMPSGESPITSFQYFLTQLHVIPYYIKLLFLPANLNLDYDWSLTRNIDLPTVLFFILLVGIVVIAIKLFKRSRLVSFGIIWFFVTLSVTSSFVVIRDVIFEHRLYLPSVGFAIFVAVMISKISKVPRAILPGYKENALS